MNQFASRLRSFRTPRLSLLVLLIGLSVSAIVRSRLAAGAPSREATIASLDSAIAAAVPPADDTTGASSERLRALVSRRRDVELEAQTAIQKWFYWSLGGSTLVLAAIVSGSIAFVSHLRGGPSNEAD